MRFLSNSRARWFVLAGLWVVLLVFGIGGFVEQAHRSGEHRSFLDTLYLCLQLVTLDYKGTGDDLNWRLQIARFVAPIMAAGTVLQTASLIFADQFRRFRLRFASGHTIVCGLGDVGHRLAAAFADAGERVVAIDQHRDQRNAGFEGRDVTVITGDAGDIQSLRAARVERASRLVCVCGDDATNVKIALLTAKVPRRSDVALRCTVQLSDSDLAGLLGAADLDADGNVRISFFNVHERAARALVGERPPFEASGEAGGAGGTDHVVVLGLGQFGRSLVVAIAQAWAARSPAGPLPVTLIDRIASGRWEALCMQHPALRDVCTPTTLDIDLQAPSTAGIAAMRRVFAEEHPTWVAVAFEDESTALSSALFVQQSLAAPGTPIVLRTRTETGLGALLQPRSGRVTGFSNLAVFPFLDRTCTISAVDAGVREQLARAFHEQYLADNADGDAVAAGSDLRRPWDELDDHQRELSRRRADGVLDDLGAVGRSLTPIRSWGAPSSVLDVDEITVLAERDHASWFADRVGEGWTYGEQRDNALKHNPMLLPWADLPTAVRTMNESTVAALPAMLARAGFEMVRRSPGAA